MAEKPIKHLARSGLTVILVLLVCTSSAVGVISPDSATSPTVSDDQFVAGTDNVSFWERAVLPLRVDTANGATVINNGNMFINLQSRSTSDIPLNKQQLAVFNPDQTLTFTFEGRTGAGTEKFSGEDTDLLVAKFAEKPSALSTDGSGLGIQQARSLLTSDNANENATFELVDAGQLNSDGALTTTYNLDENGAARGAGHYMFFLVQDGGFEVEKGDLSVTGQARVLGFDAVAVQHSPATASINDKTATPGQELRVDVGTDLPGDTEPHRGGNSQHQALLVYHEETFKDSRTVIRISGDLEGDITADQVTIEHDITTLNGTATNEDSISLAGATIGDGTRDGPVSVGGVLDFLADSGTVTPPANEPDGTTRLDGVAIVNVTSPEDGAFYFTPASEWERGTYRYVYVAGDNSTRNFSTATGTFDLENEPTDRHTGDNDDHDSSSDDDDSSTTSSPAYEPPVTVDTKNGSAHVTIDRINANTPVRATFPSQINSTDSSLDGLEFEFARNVSNFSAQATGLTTRPLETPFAPRPTTLSYFSINISGASETDLTRANITFRVSEERLTALGVSPSQVRLYRYHDGEWHELETTSLGNGRFTAQTPGFSVFSVGVADAQQSGTETPTDPTDTPTSNETATSTTATTPETDDNGGIPTWTVAVVLLVLAAVGGVLYYRQQQY